MRLDNSRPQLFERILVSPRGDKYHCGFRIYYPNGRCFFMDQYEMCWRVSCFSHSKDKTILCYDYCPYSAPLESTCFKVYWKYRTIKDCKKAAEKWDKNNHIETKFVCYW